MAHSVARKLISSEVVSISPDDQSLSLLHLQNIREVFYWLLKSFAKTALDLMSTKPGFLPVSVSPMQTVVQSIKKRDFPLSPEGCGILPHGLPLITVQMCAWNQPASTGSRFSMSLRKHAMSYLLTPSTPNRRREIRPTVRMRNGSVICSCAT